MTLQKDFKRLVRQRMQKTGESYTAARAVLQTTSVRPSSATRPLTPDYATLAGLSDAAVKAKTGCGWDKWVYALDRAKADQWPHPKIAAHVHEKYGIGNWWAQTVTVGYERIKGLRAIGQRRDGHFDQSRSRTLPVPIATAYRAFKDGRTRAKWLPDVKLTIRTAIVDRSMRITWPDGTSVEVSFTAKGAGKTQVTVSHVKLADAAAAARPKAYWGERLDALAAWASAKRTGQ